jgi:hypothetical protein
VFLAYLYITLNILICQQIVLEPVFKHLTSTKPYGNLAPMETPEKKTTARDLFLRTIAVLGLIAILLLGAWGIIQLAFALPTVFSNLSTSVSSLFTHTTTPTATSTKESIVVTVPPTTVSGQTLQISWKHQNGERNAQYSYAVSYACQSGLSLRAPLPNGNFQAVPCNTPFNYVNTNDRMSLMPSVTTATPLALTVTATKLSSNAVTSTGTATVQVTAPAAMTKPTSTKPTTTTTKPTTTKPTTTYYPSPKPVAALYGYGDLAVTITSIAPASNGVTTIKFTIENLGTNTTQAGWSFNATLPINGSYNFASQPQQALNPGDKIAYVLTFNAGTNYGYQGYGNTASGYTTSGYTCQGYTCSNNNTVVTGYPYQNNGYQTGVVIINVDPSNYVPEQNENNNIAQTTVPLY